MKEIITKNADEYGRKRFVENYSKVINGKKYDTATANFVDCAWINEGDGKCICLFLKKTNEFFKYEVTFRGSRYYEDDYEVISQIITPLTYDESKDLCEKYYSGYTYVKMFGEVEE